LSSTIPLLKFVNSSQVVYQQLEFANPQHSPSPSKETAYSFTGNNSNRTISAIFSTSSLLITNFPIQQNPNNSISHHLLSPVGFHLIIACLYPTDLSHFLLLFQLGITTVEEVCHRKFSRILSVSYANEQTLCALVVQPDGNGGFEKVVLLLCGKTLSPLYRLPTLPLSYSSDLLLVLANPCLILFMVNPVKICVMHPNGSKLCNEFYY
jgi:hypothetical protein